MKDAKINTETLAKAQVIISNAETEKAKHAETVTELNKVKKGNLAYKKENDFLNIKLDHCQAKLSAEVEVNSNLFANRKVYHASLNADKQSESDSLEKR